MRASTGLALAPRWRPARPWRPRPFTTPPAPRRWPPSRRRASTPRAYASTIADSFPFVDYCLALARWGGYVSIDNIGRQAGAREADVTGFVLVLIEASHSEQILLSQRVGQAHELRSRGRRGYTHLTERFLPALREAGVPEMTIHTITVENPRRWLTITPKT